MTLHDPLLGDLYSAEPEPEEVREDVPEAAAAPDLLDSFAAGCRQTWQDIRAWGPHPLEALTELKHWQPPSAADHDLYVETVDDRFEAWHQRWIGRGGVRLGVAWIAFVQRGRIFWPAVLAAAAIALAVILATR